jgi:hypothetical protein
MTSKISQNEGTLYEPASPDLHDAVCCEFKDLGVQDTPWGPKHQGMLVFQVAERNDEGSRKEVRMYFTMTLGSDDYPSRIRKFVEKWRGKALSDEELDEFDLELLVGKPCRLDTIVKESKKGRQYAAIESVLKASDVKLEPEDYVPVDDREEKNGSSDKRSDDDMDDDVPF